MKFSNVSSTLRQASIIAGDELREILLRRRSLLSLLVYVAVVAGSLWLLFRVQRVMGVNLIRPVDQEAYQRLLFKMQEVGMGEVFTILVKLSQLPEMLWIFQLFSVLWFPTLVALVSCDAITVDVYRGTLRFLLLRTSRTAYYLGKFLAHTILYFVLQIAGILVVWVLSYFTYQRQDLWALSKFSLYYAAVFVPYLMWLVAMTQLVSSWSRRPMSALVRVHVLWVLLIMLAIQWPKMTPLAGDLVYGLFAPFEHYPTAAFFGYLFWSILFFGCGLLGFLRREV
jgi:ABC-type transport system involved in multi-copper enzyme maturation permease subunit